jgi:hypothetical protein
VTCDDEIAVDPLTLRELRSSLDAIGAFNSSESWTEASAGLRKVSLRLGSLLISRAGLDPDGTDLRQVAVGVQDHRLMAIPWELAAWTFSDWTCYPFAPGESAMIRSESHLRPPGRGPLPDSAAITILAEKPIHCGLADLTESVDSIRNTIERNHTALSIGTLRKPPLAARPTKLLHLIGHGYETAGVDARFEYGMHCASLRDELPEDCYGEASAERVAQELERYAPIDVLLLDGCYTGGGFRWDGERWRNPLCTYAARLGCSVVISFFDAVRSSQARLFCQHFYDRIFAGDSPLAAAVSARNALFRTEADRPLHECDWWKVRIATGVSDQRSSLAAAAEFHPPERSSHRQRGSPPRGATRDRAHGSGPFRR